MIKKVLLLAAVVLPMFASAQTIKMAVVDRNEIISKMPESAAANTQLQEMQKKLEAEMEVLNKERQRQIEEFQALKPDTPAAIVDGKRNQIQATEQRMQEFDQKAYQDMQAKQQELMVPIIQKIQSAIESVAKDNGISTVQDKEVFIFFQEPVEDITPKVKSRLGI